MPRVTPSPLELNIDRCTIANKHFGIDFCILWRKTGNYGPLPTILGDSILISTTTTLPPPPRNLLRDSELYPLRKVNCLPPRMEAQSAHTIPPTEFFKFN